MISDKVIAEVNASPVLLSALYDMNLMPEQVVTKEQAGALMYFVAGYALGRSATSDVEPSGCTWR
mgnify:CR=1 FL=1|tara:strand:- start:639 stop:833 length:195 start_codon:yes stop_codon:yes gene_type:complete